MRRGLALGGFSGAGKSTVARALAARTGMPCLDLDALLVERYGPIAAQFADDGEPVFRAREAALVREVAAGAPAVVATGGGTWVDPENRRLLRSFAWTVVLWATAPELRRRIGATDPTRPLWDDRIEARLAERSSAYEEADLRVSTDGRSADDVVAEIERWWRNRPGSGAGTGGGAGAG